jgi:hypothetical protein
MKSLEAILARYDRQAAIRGRKDLNNKAHKLTLNKYHFYKYDYKDTTSGMFPLADNQSFYDLLNRPFKFR